MWVLIDTNSGYRIARKLAYCVRRQGRRFRAIFFAGTERVRRVAPNVKFETATSDTDIFRTALRLHRLSGGRVVVITRDRALKAWLRNSGVEALTPEEAIEKLCSEG